VVAALLAAAGDSGAEAWRVMRETLEPVLAELWLTDRGLLTAWSPGPASPPDITLWRGGVASRRLLPHAACCEISYDAPDVPDPATI